MEISIEEFEKEILEVLDNLPSKFRKEFKNISFIIEDEETGPFFEEKTGVSHYRLGLYHGVPMTSKTSRGQLFPDRIIIYKKPIEAVSKDRQTLRRNIKRVVLHEVGHYFGINESRLRELGY
jgi:predicted Zn-dependent protease with MMP-like domain